jgi:D-alanyl-D-alanine carboxypeptidase (penicillin-binding protein 5/6)
VLAVLLFLLMWGTAAQAQEEDQENREDVPERPQVEAAAWALVDGESGRFLAGENADERLQTASLAKIMTALVVLEDDVDLDAPVRISARAEEYVGFSYSNVGLIEGERVSARDLLVASLVPSGTEAAYALAEYAGDGDVEAFVDRMNEEARELGLGDTRFDSPVGEDSPDNYSSARDLAALTRAALGYEEFAEIVGRDTASIRATGAREREIDIVNTNALLDTYGRATGVKTGTTPEAGPSLVASAEGDGESYVAVVLDAGAENGEEGDRFDDATAILDYGFDAHESEAVIRRDEVYGRLDVPFRRGASVELAAEREVEALVGPDTEIEERVSTGEAPPSARAGQELGEVEALVDGESVGASPLVATEGYEAAGFFGRTWYRAREFFDQVRQR